MKLDLPLVVAAFVLFLFACVLPSTDHFHHPHWVWAYGCALGSAVCVLLAWICYENDIGIGRI